MSNPVEPSGGAFIADSLHAGDYPYVFASPTEGTFEVPGSAESPDEANVADVEMPFAMHSPLTPAMPPMPEGVVPSPSLDLSFLSQPGHVPMPSPKLAEATQPQPASGVSPSAPSSPDVHPTEMPATPVSPGVAESAAGEANELAAESPVNVEPPAPSAIETPPAPIASPPGPVAGEPNVAVGQLPTGAAMPASAVGTAPVHPEPQPPAAADMQMQMSQNMAEQMATILQDILRTKAP